MTPKLRLGVIYGMNFMIEIYITRNLHILWMYIPDTTIYIKFIKSVNTEFRLQNRGAGVVDLDPC